ncbi:calcium-dependent protein kinase [Cymbomonas tetramitiformis]|uniref:Calcium-dependent protein kinase n=1 Tax=Cymbomonas tetramitiformis TaxID=36881 RepID=A0AAE0FCB3_9CHLO|nr:calcium-dependent protein kinase [Cymbomonas tetramitiformis]
MQRSQAIRVVRTGSIVAGAISAAVLISRRDKFPPRWANALTAVGITAVAGSLASTIYAHKLVRTGETTEDSEKTEVEEVPANAAHEIPIVVPEIRLVTDVYSFGKELGRGAFGITKHVKHKETGEQFACKVINRKSMTINELKDIESEIAVMHHLQGVPNIIGFRERFDDKDRTYLVMEFAQGGDLFDKIVNLGYFSESMTANTIRTVLQVVARCHALGVAHRDIKPENFLLSTCSPDAELMAIDFGLSSFISPGQKFQELIGSPFYVAPEVLKRCYSQEADVWSVGVMLYIMLSGIPPFWAESDAEIFKCILRGRYDLTGEPWPSISAPAKDLLAKLLEVDPSKRLTAVEALEHPWLAENAAPETPLDFGILHRLKKFSQANKFKKMALHFIAGNLSGQEIEGLKGIFQTLDNDGNGTVTAAELTEGLAKLQKEKGLGDAEVQSLLAACDMDGNGTLSYEEFLAATLHQHKFESRENLWKAFKHFDQDDSGYITKDELIIALKQHGSSSAEVEELITSADTNGDGKIEYEEFAAMMQSRS